MEEQEQPKDLAPMKAQVYKDPRPVEYFARFHERARTRDPDWVYEAVRVAMTFYARLIFPTRGIAPEKVRGDGAVILAPNHFSFMDHFFLGVSIRRKVRLMAKSQMFTRRLPWIYNHGGVVPVPRAAHLIGRGGTVGMDCEGARSRTGKLAEQPKRGIGRLALMTGATVVP